MDDLHETSSGGEETDTDSMTEEEQSWISWFVSIRGNELFCEVEEDYIHDEFNLTGLSAEVPYFDYALDTILDVDSPNAELLTEEQQETVDAAAELLYGLIHARYILTSKGLNAMFDKFQDVDFGRCSRVYCEGQPLLPVGQSDIPRKYTVTLYCPRCNDIYYPRSSRHANIDGAYFGTTFPHLFLMTFPACIPPPPLSIYVPRVFGFRVRREGAGGSGGEEGASGVDPAWSGRMGVEGGSALRPAAPVPATTAIVPTTLAGLPPVRAVGPAGMDVTVASTAVGRGGGGTAAVGLVRPPGVTRMGRIAEIASVVPRDDPTRPAARDEILDDDEEEDEEGGGGGGGGEGRRSGGGPMPSVAVGHAHGRPASGGKAASSHRAGVGGASDPGLGGSHHHEDGGAIGGHHGEAEEDEVEEGEGVGEPDDVGDGRGAPYAEPRVMNGRGGAGGDAGGGKLGAARSGGWGGTGSVARVAADLGHVSIRSGGSVVPATVSMACGWGGGMGQGEPHVPTPVVGVPLTSASGCAAGAMVCDTWLDGKRGVACGASLSTVTTSAAGMGAGAMLWEGGGGGVGRGVNAWVATAGRRHRHVPVDEGASCEGDAAGGTRSSR